jgi:DNA-binding LacI/PurR family transcriptional regulator
MQGREKITRKPAKPRRVRMIDVAREAGVSYAAVSFALSGQDRIHGIHPKTAEKIRRVARQLDFHPSHAAQQLAGKRSGVIAVLANNFFNQPPLRAFSWLNHVASPRGLETVAWEFGPTAAVDEYVGKCLAWNVDGLIFLAMNDKRLKPKAAKALARLPRVVSLFDDPGIPGGYCIEFDSNEGVRQAVGYLYGQGRRKVVQILENLDTMMNRRRHEAFLAVHKELGRRASKDQICLATQGWGHNDYPKFAALCDELIDRRGADAIFADNDFTATFLAKAIQRRGLLPKDVAVVGWGNETLSVWANPALTTVSFRMKEMVTAALDLLGELIERPDQPRTETIRITPELVVRESA